MPDEIKQVIINQCSPVLLGCKPAALFPLGSENSFAELSDMLRPRFNTMVMRKNQNGLLVLVFEQKRLEEIIRNRDAVTSLAALGYPGGASLFALLDYLRGQFVRNDFPHEIGIFLGYPVEDVLGFVRYKGRNCKLCGYWKVYGDAEYAAQCFKLYDACRECFRALISD